MALLQTVHMIVCFFQVKSQQIEVMRILESKKIEYKLVDISQDEELRNEMRTKSGNPTAAPPQLFNEDQYCGVRTVPQVHLHFTASGPSVEVLRNFDLFCLCAKVLNC